MTASSAAKLAVLLRTLKLPSFKAQYDEVARLADRESWTFPQYLMHLAEGEIEDRRQRRIERLLRQSGLPKDKTLATLDQSRLPGKIRRQLATLCEGDFVQRAENVLAFGLPGRGKTHCVSAIGHELVQRGYEVLFQPAFAIVQRLLIAKRELSLEKELRRLDRFAVVILDDIGYVQQDREEMEVLFTLLAERYERRSVVITSNLVFSQWDKIFKDAMTTAAAIDRVVHHSAILELTGESYRSEQAKKRNSDGAKASKPAKAAKSPAD
ncbi:MAG: ATP-binding protein [Planctomycetes bacterium]|nr:ATP-binding protein [Planctomycetota bacterium]MCB9872490.1 ATP-binding protein [Planctomycetota bacterium]MCB9888645.1 ATP-binding protein [Planctomycetota bacterium]MCB9889312.1 ATP-binding protein [Planctomycetota bacterium]